MMHLGYRFRSPKAYFISLHSHYVTIPSPSQPGTGKNPLHLTVHEPCYFFILELRTDCS